MKHEGVKPADAAIWSGGWADNRSSGSSGGEKGESSATYTDTPAKEQTDKAVFSHLARLEQEEHRSGHQEPESRLRDLMRMLEQSNRHMHRQLQNLRRSKVNQKTVPSVLGLPLQTASTKLQMCELRLQGVTQEYNPGVLPGHVSAQTPGPGSRAAALSGVQLVISKGPPPDAAKRPGGGRGRNMRSEIKAPGTDAPRREDSLQIGVPDIPPAPSGAPAVTVSFTEEAESPLKSESPLKYGPY